MVGTEPVNNSLAKETLASLKRVGIRLNAEGSLFNKDYDQLQQWAEQYPDYPIEWLEHFEDTVKEQGINRFDTAMRYLHASAAQEIPVGKRPSHVKREGDITEAELERHFAKVAELRAIEGTREWQIAQAVENSA